MKQQVPIICPDGTKLWLLDLGSIELDDIYVLSNSQGIGTLSSPQPAHRRVELVVYAVLIAHPKAGLLLYDTGIAHDMESAWGVHYESSPRKHYTSLNALSTQIELTGYKLSDVKAVIISHLHADHAGGLEYFYGTGVPIYVHDEELKNALWCVYNKMDRGVYHSGYMRPELNWTTFGEKITEIFPGITMHHCPGHTPGLCCMQVDLPKSGTFIFTGDQFHVRENYENETPQGMLSRDRNAWLQSLRHLQRLERITEGKMIFGHDMDQFRRLKSCPEYYD